MRDSTAVLNKTVRRQKNLSLAFISWSKSVAEVGDIPLPEQEYDDIAYLNTLGSQDANYWTCGIQVNGQYVNFKVDTGAEVTVISEHASRALGLDTLQPSTRKLHGPDHSPLNVVGQATVRLAYRDKQCTHISI